MGVVSESVARMTVVRRRAVSGIIARRSDVSVRDMNTSYKGCVPTTCMYAFLFTNFMHFSTHHMQHCKQHKRYSATLFFDSFAYFYS